MGRWDIPAALQRAAGVSLLTETAWVSSCTLAGEGLNFIEGGMAKARDRDRAWR